jgi:hypothetical protein
MRTAAEDCGATKCLAILFIAEYNALILQPEFLLVACPFFMPTDKLADGGWLHPSRLPLGGGWIGHCSAPGHEGAEPTNQELREFCNLGYAAGCPRLPEERAYDAVRFSVAHDRGAQLMLWFVCESRHRPRGPRNAGIRSLARPLDLFSLRSEHTKNGGLLFAIVLAA